MGMCVESHLDKPLDLESDFTMWIGSQKEICHICGYVQNDSLFLETLSYLIKFFEFETIIERIYDEPVYKWIYV